MQKIATRVFIYSSALFGTLGVYMALSGTDPGSDGSSLQRFISRLFMATVFVILSSFALSVAGKYLDGNRK